MESGAPGRSYAADVVDAIRAELARRRLSQAELASQIGRSQLWISRRLRGVVAITVDDVDLIAGCLGIPTEDLLARRAA